MLKSLFPFSSHHALVFTGICLRLYAICTLFGSKANHERPDALLKMRISVYSSKKTFKAFDSSSACFQFQLTILTLASNTINLSVIFEDLFFNLRTQLTLC